MPFGPRMPGNGAGMGCDGVRAPDRIGVRRHKGLQGHGRAFKIIRDLVWQMIAANEGLVGWRSPTTRRLDIRQVFALTWIKVTERGMLLCFQDWQGSLGRGTGRCLSGLLAGCRSEAGWSTVGRIGKYL